MDARMAVLGDDFVCLADEDDLQHNDDRLNSKHTGKEHEECLCSTQVIIMGTLLNDFLGDALLHHHAWCRSRFSEHDHQGEFLEIKPDMFHTPLTIKESR